MLVQPPAVKLPSFLATSTIATPNGPALAPPQLALGLSATLLIQFVLLVYFCRL